MSFNAILNLIGSLAAASTAIPGLPGWVGTVLSVAAFAAGKLAASPVKHPAPDSQKYGDSGSP